MQDGVTDDTAVSALLRAARQGDEAAFQAVYVRCYGELRQLAHRLRRRHASGTLNTTALVHEAYIKLSPGRLAAQDRAHFLRIAARAMRQVLVDAARRRSARERNLSVLPVSGLAGSSEIAATDVLALDDALRGLELVSPRQASVVECRFFAGLSVDETAAALEVSAPTVKRDWRVARAWLAHALTAGAPPSATA